MTDETISLLRLPAVCERTGLKRSSLYRLIAAGSFPRPIRITGTTISAWDSRAVDSWIRQQLSTARSA